MKDQQSERDFSVVDTIRPFLEGRTVDYLRNKVQSPEGKVELWKEFNNWIASTPGMVMPAQMRSYERSYNMGRLTYAVNEWLASFDPVFAKDIDARRLNTKQAKHARWRADQRFMEFGLDGPPSPPSSSLGDGGDKKSIEEFLQGVASFLRSHSSWDIYNITRAQSIAYANKARLAGVSEDFATAIELFPLVVEYLQKASDLETIEAVARNPPRIFSVG
jgi:hypothetical protein